MATDKDTVYIDIDDEITGIIDKMRNSDGKVVALVLPKRASVFQSIVNMKLLKRAADTEKKNLVLITSEAGLMPLAGAAGVHVAKTLNSKPEIPAGPDNILDDEESIDETGEDIPEENLAETAGTTAVGTLAGTAAGKAGSDDLETVELDNTDPEEAAGTGKPKSFAPPKGVKKDKKLKVPNFNKFRLLLTLGVVALIALIVFGYLAIKVWPKATITIDTNASTIDTNIELHLSTTATELNEEERILPAKQVQQQKTYTQQIATTGQKNNGNKASGYITVTAGPCSGDVPASVPAGTGVSSSGQTYITQDSISFTPSVSRGKCVFRGISGNGQSNIAITAQAAGTASNTSGSNFTFSGRPGLDGKGSATGGTDNIVRVVNQNDINNAKAKINTDDAGIKTDLRDQLKDADYYSIDATYSTGNPSVTASSNVGQVADNVTVTQTVTYTMFGVKEDDLKKLVENDIKGSIDTNEQSVLDNGINKAVFTMNGSNSTTAQVTMRGKATVGPYLDIANIRRESLGKKPPVVREMFNDNSDITDVDVKLSPFWVSSVPNDEKKVVVKIATPAADKSDNSDDSNP